MSSPSKAVDVLAVMANAVTFARAYHLPNSADDYEAAHSAVARLIAAAAELSRDLEHAMALANFEKEGTVAADHPLRVSLDALDAALSTIGESQ